MHCENRGKCDAASGDCCQRQPVPGTRLNTAHAPAPKKSTATHLFRQKWSSPQPSPRCPNYVASIQPILCLWRRKPRRIDPDQQCRIPDICLVTIANKKAALSGNGVEYEHNQQHAG